MKEFVKYFDFFAIKFNFYTNNQPRFRNVFGGIMNLIYLLICIIIFIEFSYEDLFKLKPSISLSEIYDPAQKKVNTNKEKIWIPFRVITYDEKFIDHRGILYILPYFIEGKLNNITGMEFKNHLLRYKLCNETSMANKTDNYIINVPLNEIFCIDEDDISFGGSFNGNFFNYIEINLHLCKDGINFNSSDSKCTKVNDLFKYKNSSWLFEFFYPVVHFQPTNLETPLTVIYKSHINRLESYTHKVNNLFLQEHILSDNSHLILNNNINSSFWGISTIYGDNYFSPKESEPIKNIANINNKSSCIYSLGIYMDFIIIHYSREYKKLLLIISNVFPLFRFALYFIKSFTKHVKMSIIKSKLVGLIFENRATPKANLFKYRRLNQLIDEKDKTKYLSVNDGPKELMFGKKNDSSLSENKSICAHSNDKDKDKKSNNKSILLNSNISLNNNNLINILNRKEMSDINSKQVPILHELPNKPKDDSTSPDKILNNSSRKNAVFPFHYFFLDFYFDRLINPQQFHSISQKYFTVYNFMSQIYDISTHILLFKQFNLINNGLKKIYEEKGFCPARPFRKININNNELMETLNKELNKKGKSIIFSKNLY